MDEQTDPAKPAVPEVAESDKISLDEQSKARMLLWVQALESGEHEQGYGFLETVSGLDGLVRRCCLGVLCRVAMADGLGLELVQDQIIHPGGVEGGSQLAVKFNNHGTSAPLVVVDWLFNQKVRYDGNGQTPWLNQNALIHFNDEEMRDFRYIAAYLRQLYRLDE